MGTPSPEITPGITQKQRRLLRAGIRSLGLEESYRDILRAQAGVSSSLDLTLEGFQAVMLYLTVQGFSYAPPRGGYESHLESWRSRVGSRPGKATPEQLALIETIWDRLEWYWSRDGKGSRDAALHGFLVARFACEDLRFLSFAGARGVIEALKGVESRRTG